MKKILGSMRYKIGYQLVWAAWYLSIYVVFMFLSYLMLIKSGILNYKTGSLSYRLWSAFLFQFAVSIRFKEDFDLFLTFGNTRAEIFQILSGAALGFSVLFSALIVLERFLFDFLNHSLGLQNVKDFFHYFAPYNTDHFLMQFLFFFLLCTCFSACGLLIGSLFYRFGKKFKLVFWFILISLPGLFFCLFLWPLYQPGQLAGIMTAMGELLINFNVPAACSYLFLLTILFSLTAYLNMRQLSQK